MGKDSQSIDHTLLPVQVFVIGRKHIQKINIIFIIWISRYLCCWNISSRGYDLPSGLLDYTIITLVGV